MIVVLAPSGLRTPAPSWFRSLETRNIFANRALATTKKPCPTLSARPIQRRYVSAFQVHWPWLPNKNSVYYPVTGGTHKSMLDGRVQLAAVVINYKTPDLVLQCVSSLLSQLDRENSQIVVVDNCSHDGSVTTIANWIAGHGEKNVVRLIESETNVGFSGGNNLGIRAIDADYYLLLNSDTIVRPDAIAKLYATAESNRQAGIISPRLEWPDGTPQESCFRYLSPMSEFIGAARTGPITAILKRFEIPLPLSDTIVKPHWTSFACVLLRGKMLDKIGLLDDGFLCISKMWSFAAGHAKQAGKLFTIPRPG